MRKKWVCFGLVIILSYILTLSVKAVEQVNNIEENPVKAEEQTDDKTTDSESNEVSIESEQKNAGKPELYAVAAEEPLNGQGTKEDPYQLYVVADFAKISENMEAYYELQNDIDLGSTSWSIIGSSTNPFKGTLDGNGYVIKGIKHTYSNPYKGIFGVIENATICNLTIITDVEQAEPYDVYDTKVYVGGLVQRGSGHIEHCSVKATLSGVTSKSSSKLYIGMLAGEFTGTIESCYAEGEINGHASGSGATYAGGLVGNFEGSIRNSYTNIRIGTSNNTPDYNYRGGLIGCAKGAVKIENCYTNNSSYRFAKSGNSFVGTEEKNSVGVVNSYYNAERISSEDGFGMACTEDELRNKNTYTGWDFENIWEIDTSKNGGFPRLKGIRESEDSWNRLEPQLLGFTDRTGQYSLNGNYCVEKREELHVQFDCKISVENKDGIYLYNKAENDVIALDVKVSEDGHTLELIPTNDMEVGDRYSIIIESDAVKSSKSSVFFTRLTKELYDAAKLYITVNVVGEWMEGKGTEEEPYQVYTPTQLFYINYRLNSCYSLEDDLDMFSYKNGVWTGIGGANPFTGIFDGNEHVVTGIAELKHYSISLTDYYAGLFARTKDAVIRNLGVVSENDILINAGRVDFGNSYNGGIVGSGSGTLENCFVKAEINKTSGGEQDYLGMLAGRFDGKVENCFAMGSLNNNGGGSYEYGFGLYAGGLVGNGKVKIKDCYCTADINVKFVDGVVGGIGGQIDSSNIQNCYYVGKIEPDFSYYKGEGGILGKGGSTTVENCYYNSDLLGIENNEFGTGKATEAMKNIGTYEGWDFEHVWNQGQYTNSGYPFLDPKGEIIITEFHDVTEDELYRKFPEYLFNKSTMKIESEVIEACSDRIEEYNDGWKTFVSAYLYALRKAADLTDFNIIQGIYGLIIEPGKMDKSISDDVAKEILVAALENDEYVNQLVEGKIEKIQKATNRVEKLLNEVVDGTSGTTIKEIGDKSISVYAQEMERSFGIPQADVENLMRETIETYRENQTAAVQLEKLDYIIDSLKICNNIFLISELPIWVIEDMQKYLNPHTELYKSLERLRKEYYSLGTITGVKGFLKMVTKLFDGEIIKNMMDTNLKDFTKKPEFILAKIIIKQTIKYTPISPADQLLRTHYYLQSTVWVGYMANDYRNELIKGQREGEYSEDFEVLKQRHQMYYEMYLHALKSSVDAASNLKGEDNGRLNNAKKMLDKYTLEQYLQICRQSARIANRTYYNLLNGKAMILDKEGNFQMAKKRMKNKDSVLLIPADVDGYEVNGINAYAFSGNDTVETLFVEEGIEEIRDGAFSNCPNLETVILPKSLKKIGAGAFANCPKLQSIKFGIQIEEIGTGAFSENENLEFCCVENSVAYDFAINEDIGYRIIKADVTEISMQTLPVCEKYVPGEVFDDLGMSINVKYEDGTAEIIQSGWVIDLSQMRMGENEAKVYYGNCETSFSLQAEKNEQPYTVEYKSLEGYQLDNPKKATALFGDEVTEYPIEIEGYSAEKESYSEIVGAGNTVITIWYDRNEYISIEDATVTEIEAQEYDGKPVRPKVVVKLGDKELEEGKDFVVFYIHNNGKGTGRIIIRGIGIYSGEKEVTFEIKDDQINTADKADKPNGKNEEAGKDTGVMTGDSNKVMIWIALLLLSVLGLFGANICLKKRNVL